LTGEAGGHRYSLENGMQASPMEFLIRGTIGRAVLRTETTASREDGRGRKEIVADRQSKQLTQQVFAQHVI
jgi:DNA-binding transcriptional regulator YiaG